jgi:hypothetical protein
MTRLAQKVGSLDDVDEKFHDLYEQGEDGAFALGIEGIEGHVPKGKVDEFRANNLKLQDQIKELTGQIPDAEKLEAFNTWQEQEEERKFAQAKKKGEVEKLIKQADDKWAEKFKAEQAATQAMRERLRKTILKAEFAPLLQKHEADWTLLEGVIGNRVAVDEDNDFSLVVNLPDGNRMVGDNGEFASPDDLLAELKEHDSYGKAFAGKRGFGGGGNNNPGGGSKVGSNPWSKSTWNFTKQNEITTKNPALAARMKELAAAEGQA